MNVLADIPHLVSWTIFLPAIGALVVLLVPGVNAVRWTALVATSITFLISLGLWFGFDPAVATTDAPQLAERVQWFPGINITYYVGIDGLNLLLILLATLLGPIIVLSSWTYIGKYHKGYYALMLLLQTGVIGVFASFDLFLFYVFFELTLIPMYFIIGIWGGEERIYAAVKFVIYTLVGSLLMLVGVLWLGWQAGLGVNDGVFTTEWFQLVEFGVPGGAQTWLFLLFALAFMIKVPLFPLHTWLPDAHVQAPTGGSVVLAGVLLKMGTYGLVRFCLPIFPDASVQFAWPIAILAVIGILYGGFVAYAQKDAKKLIAYSSVAHLGFVVLGIFAFTTEALQGAMIQMINHGISTGALFLIVGMMYERRHSRLMADYGGIAKTVPILTFFMVLSVMASVGLPGLNGFVGEFLILLGAFRSGVIGNVVLIGLATAGVIVAAIYLLTMVYKTFWGPVTWDANREMKDLNGREVGLLMPLAALMFILGFYPAPFLARSEPAVQSLLETVEQKRGISLAEAEAREELVATRNRAGGLESGVTDHASLVATTEGAASTLVATTDHASRITDHMSHE
jgi:NADH-quinone oxidoreductase subunit M